MAGNLEHGRPLNIHDSRAAQLGGKLWLELLLPGLSVSQHNIGNRLHGEDASVLQTLEAHGFSLEAIHITGYCQSHGNSSIQG